MNGIKKPDLQALGTIKDRITFVYVERCKISRDNGAITVHDEQGTKAIPAAMILLLCCWDPEQTYLIEQLN